MWQIYCDFCDNKWSHIHIMPMEDVLNTLSGDGDYETETVKDLMKHKRDKRYEDVVGSIKTQGFQPGKEPEWDYYGGNNMVTNGHHRITALFDLGAKWCPDGRYNASVYA